MPSLKHWQSLVLLALWVVAIGSTVAGQSIWMTLIDRLGSLPPTDLSLPAYKTVFRDWRAWRAYTWHNRIFAAVREHRRKFPGSRLPFWYLVSLASALVAYVVLFSLLAYWDR